ncbi:hypothetical protein N7537_007999 [Penicillium hordei]|uniref:Uncharacterized protein n=1 Tax=Penicillium hordei TaxID=40994 RepID=A0AAD6DZL9_9EURO|nr:uncharacterized protein N7537_007999 [Penicillium hordei]KAJ5597915.1 hypothetical protein N7537_007999 [Penicillium hordei]
MWILDVAHRASIKLELALNLESHIHSFKKKKKPSGGNQPESRSALLPSAGKTSFSSRWLVLSLFFFYQPTPPPVIFSF